MTQQELINAVRIHAEAHYEKDGWDYLVECWEDSDIADAIGKARTTQGAIKKCREIVKAMDSYRADVRAEIF